MTPNVSGLGQLMKVKNDKMSCSRARKTHSAILALCHIMHHCDSHNGEVLKMRRFHVCPMSPSGALWLYRKIPIGPGGRNTKEADQHVLCFEQHCDTKMH
jgi:hypothetical protein